MQSVNKSGKDIPNTKKDKIGFGEKAKNVANFVKGGAVNIAMGALLAKGGMALNESMNQTNAQKVIGNQGVKMELTSKKENSAKLNIGSTQEYTMSPEDKLKADELRKKIDFYTKNLEIVKEKNAAILEQQKLTVDSSGKFGTINPGLYEQNVKGYENVHNKMQAEIDEYKAQLDALENPGC